MDFFAAGGCEAAGEAGVRKGFAHPQQKRRRQKRSDIDPGGDDPRRQQTRCGDGNDHPFAVHPIHDRADRERKKEPRQGEGGRAGGRRDREMVSRWSPRRGAPVYKRPPDWNMPSPSISPENRLRAPSPLFQPIPPRFPFRPPLAHPFVMGDNFYDHYIV